MLELTSTRSNPMVDPGLHLWGWEIASTLVKNVPLVLS